MGGSCYFAMWQGAWVVHCKHTFEKETVVTGLANWKSNQIFMKLGLWPNVWYAWSLLHRGY